MTSMFQIFNHLLDASLWQPFLKEYSFVILSHLMKLVEKSKTRTQIKLFLEEERKEARERLFIWKELMLFQMFLK